MRRSSKTTKKSSTILKEIPLKKILQIINKYAKAHLVIRRNMQNSIWKMVKKISGKVQCPPIKQLEKNGNIITNKKRDREYVGRNNCIQLIGRKLHRKIQEKQKYHGAESNKFYINK